MSTTSSILDDFLIDTTRLSLIRRYKPPFELDRLVLSAEKKQIMLALMKQQRDADKDLGPPPESSSSGNQMDVDAAPAAPAAAQTSMEESKMDVDEPVTAVKEEKTEISPPTPPNVATQKAQGSFGPVQNRRSLLRPIKNIFLRQSLCFLIDLRLKLCTPSLNFGFFLPLSAETKIFQSFQ